MDWTQCQLMSPLQPYGTDCCRHPRNATLSPAVAAAAAAAELIRQLILSVGRSQRVHYSGFFPRDRRRSDSGDPYNMSRGLQNVLRLKWQRVAGGQ